MKRNARRVTSGRRSTSPLTTRTDRVHILPTRWGARRLRSKPGTPSGRADDDDSGKEIRNLMCQVQSCKKKTQNGGRYCPMHYWRLRNHGSLDLPPKPETAPTKWVTRWGYMHVYLPGHPMANSAGAVYEHRLVMSEHIGRPLTPVETVHHINGDRLDNRVENLELWSKSHPSGQRVSDKVEWAIELLRTYAPEVLTESSPANGVAHPEDGNPRPGGTRS